MTSISDILKTFSKTLKKLEQGLAELKDFEPTLKIELDKFEGQITDLREDLKLVVEKDKLISSLQDENKHIKEELKSINDQLNSISKLYQEISKEKQDTVNIRDLLSIYIILLEEVFYGRPHAKILYLLHGGKNVIGKDALTKATGFQPAVVLHSIHDLQNAGLVELDESGLVTLKKKLY